MEQKKPIEFSQSKRKLEFWKYSIFPIWIVAQLYLEFMHNWAYLFKARSTIEKDINRKGFAVIPDLFSSEDVKKITDIINNIDRDEFKLLSIDGSIRIKGLEKISKLVNILKLEKFQKICSNALNLNKPVTTLMYSETFAVDQEVVFASHPHFDTYKHQLKVIIPISDITSDSGPTEIVEYSSNIHFKLTKYYFYSFLSLSKLIRNYKPIWDKAFYLKQSGKRQLKAKVGDCLLFDSRALHRATLPKDTSRKLLWIYLS